MKNAAKQLYDFIRLSPAVQAVVQDRIFPFVAPEGTVKPFLVWSVGSESATMDARMCDALISIYFDGKDFTPMLEFADTLEELLESGNFEVGSIETGYSQQYKTMMANINANIL